VRLVGEGTLYELFFKRKATVDIGKLRGAGH
jgi:hypothetical protein